jgi:CheY-like chemotaxis protein
MKKILVAEDEQDVLYFLKLILELGEIEVITAEDGKECLRKYEKEKPDLVICDVKMPKMSGLEVYERIQDKEKFILISGIVTEEDLPKELVERGNFFIKPLPPKEFVEKVKLRLK